MSVAGLTADNVEQFGGYALLTQFIIFEPKLLEEFLRVIVGALHGHYPGGLFRGAVLGESLLHPCEKLHGQNCAENRGRIGFEEARAALSSVSATK